MDALNRAGCLKTNEPDTSRNESDARAQTEPHDDDPLEAFLQSHEENKKESLTADVKEKLRNLSELSRLKLEEGCNIIQHWFEQTKNC